MQISLGNRKKKASYLIDYMRPTDYMNPRKDNMDTENYKAIPFIVSDSKILNEIPANGTLQCLLKHINPELSVSQEYKGCLMRKFY